ncbi:HNH endonuclease [Pseudoalteromonas phage H101]|uniref:HNH homing endonuclease n=1 Tax=Pseudoalteromonas phage H101 TaxID=1654919 RepID=A0A0H4INT9_9CAUD|nr:HNH endonuclease [Pseudoalteromonas phage H101]AKO60977.1 HNH homing endonuclease [Pseudoalteromonas phage H101]
MKDTEQWKDVVGFEGFYEVSSFGRVRGKDRVVIDKRGRKLRIKSKVIAQELHKTKSYRVRLTVVGVKYSKSVHRLVAEAFIPNPENKPEVNHIDGIRLNNNLYNLEWCTREENMIHAVDTGLINNPFGKEARHSKFVTYIYKDGLLVGKSYGHKELEKLGFDYRNVHACFTGKQKSHRGHTFTREEK